MIAKAFIGLIEPKKQVKHPYHPYNGKTPAGSALGTKKDPEASKPEWWPPGVMHKHIRLVIAYLVGRGTKFRVAARNFSDLKYTYAGVSVRIPII